MCYCFSTQLYFQQTFFKFLFSLHTSKKKNESLSLSLSFTSSTTTISFSSFFNLFNDYDPWDYDTHCDYLRSRKYFHIFFSLLFFTSFFHFLFSFFFLSSTTNNSSSCSYHNFCHANAFCTSKLATTVSFLLDILNKL